MNIDFTNAAVGDLVIISGRPDEIGKIVRITKCFLFVKRVTTILNILEGDAV